jgi:cephalosporin hydroxylase
MSLALLEGNPTLNIIAVDNNPAVIKTYEAHLHASGFSSYVVCGDTVGVLKLVENDFDNISLLIVDADHSALSVFNDIKAYWPHVVVGGYVWFHDYVDLEKNGTNGVATAVHEYLDLVPSHYEFVGTPGISYIVRKT